MTLSHSTLLIRLFFFLRLVSCFSTPKFISIGLKRQIVLVWLIISVPKSLRFEAGIIDHSQPVAWLGKRMYKFKNILVSLIPFLTSILIKSSLPANNNLTQIAHQAWWHDSPGVIEVNLTSKLPQSLSPVSVTVWATSQKLNMVESTINAQPVSFHCVWWSESGITNCVIVLPCWKKPSITPLRRKEKIALARRKEEIKLSQK